MTFLEDFRFLLDTSMYLDFAIKVWPIFLVMILTVFFLAVLTSIETAILVISEAKIMRLSKKGSKNAHHLIEIKKNMTRSISGLVSMNTFVSTMGTTLLAQQTILIFGGAFTFLTSFFLAIFIIIFAKIIPKLIGDRKHDSIAVKSAGFVAWSGYLLTPFTIVTVFIVSKLIGGQKASVIEEEDIRYQLKLAREKGSFSKEKITYLESIFSLTKQTVCDVMTPSTQLEYLNEKDFIYEEKIVKDMKKSSHSRIIVVGKDINEIRGYMLKNDYFIHLINHPKEGDEKNKISRFTKSILIVEDDISVNSLLNSFQKQHQLIAVVKNKFGVTLGVVTIEDIIEQIIGEITDETDKYSDLRVRGEEKFQLYMTERSKKKEDSNSK
jgi:putative hemolysin